MTYERQLEATTKATELRDLCCDMSWMIQDEEGRETVLANYKRLKYSQRILNYLINELENPRKTITVRAKVLEAAE